MRRALRIRVHWDDDIVHESIASPPRDFVIGEGPGADFTFPFEVLGRERLQLVKLERGSVFVAQLEGERVVWRMLVHDQTLSMRVGSFVVEVAEGPAFSSPVRRFYAKPSMIGYFIGSFAALATMLCAFAFVSPPLDQTPDLDEHEERVFLLRHYLAAGAEREREPDDSQTGAGGRPRGIEGSHGKNRFGVAGPTDNPDPRIARQAALHEAAEFGLIGLLQANPGTPAPSIRPGSASGDDSDEPPSDAKTDLPGGEDYSDFGINPSVDPKKDRFSTFAIDVDTGSYFLAKRKIFEGVLPPLHAIRPEEFVNAFDYDYPGPESEPGDGAFKVELDGTVSPLERGHHLLRVGIQGRRVKRGERRPVHLVYLVDTSGSMQSEDKIGLVQSSLRHLTESLRAGDTVALSTYAGDVREVLPPTGLEHKARILGAIDELEAGGATAMASGIDLAYRLAEKTLVAGEESRVIVLSDGDANVGPMSADEILALVGRQRKRGVTLSTVGFGQGNYKDSTMERLADAGDGNYSYIGSEHDARRVFSEQVESLLQVIARDVKLQIEFDPTAVASYRLIGYENRDVADKDFRDDEIDGGEIGAGHNVTALYDVVLERRDRSPLTVRLRHKSAAGGAAVESAFALDPASIATRFESAPASLRFATAVAAFAEMLRGSPHALGFAFDDVERMARRASEGRSERVELANLVSQAAALRSDASR